MFCPNCGAELEDDALFCPECGSRVGDDAAAEKSAGAQSAGTGNTAAAGVRAAAGGAAGTAAAGKKIVAAAVGILVLIILIINGAVLKQFAIRLFTSPDVYARYVIKRNLDHSKEFAGYYGETLKNDRKITTTVSAELSEDAAEDIGDLLALVGADMDLDALTKATATWTFAGKGQQVMIEGSVELGKDRVITPQFIYDGKTHIFYGRVPEFSQTYFAIELEEMLEREDLERLDMIAAAMDTADQAMPSAAKMRSLMKRCLGAAVAEISGVEEENTVVKAEGVRQRAVELSLEIDDDMLSDMIAAALEVVAEDKDLLKMAETMDDTDLADEYGIEIADSFEDSMDLLIDGTKEIRFDETLELSLYVSNKGDIIGFEASVKSDYENAVLSAISAVSGGRYGFEAYAKEGDYKIFELTGEGRKFGNAITAEFKLIAEGVRIELNTEKLDLSKWARGEVKGRIRIGIDQFVTSEIRGELEYEGVGFLSDIADDKELVLDFATSYSKTDISLALAEGKQDYIRISFANRIEAASSIRIPAERETEYLETTGDVADYLSDGELDFILDAADRLELPREAEELLSYGVDALENGIGNFVQIYGDRDLKELGGREAAAVLYLLPQIQRYSTSGFLLPAMASMITSGVGSRLYYGYDSFGMETPAMDSGSASGGNTASVAEMTPAQADAPAESAASAEAPAAETFSEEGDVLNIYCWNEEFKYRLSDHYPGYDEIDATHGRIGNVEVVWNIIPSSGNEYRNALDRVLMDNEYAAEDERVDLFLLEADYAPVYIDTPYTLSLSELGISRSELSEQFPYTQDVMTDSNGELKGVAWQCCPGVLIYNREAAREVIGSDDPSDVQAAVDDWFTFRETAMYMAEAGYRMTATTEDMFRPLYSNASDPWVVNGKINVDNAITDWVELARDMTAVGMTTTDSMWSDAWSRGFLPEGKVFCYFGPAWFVNYSMWGDDPDSVGGRGGWGVCAGPAPFFWGGTWMAAAAGTDNPQLVADIMRKLTMDEDVMEEIALWDGDIVNNEAVLDRLSDDSSFDNPILGGQNPIAYYIDSAENIDLPESTVYDQPLRDLFKMCMADYLEGMVSYPDALEDYYDMVEAQYPELER